LHEDAQRERMLEAEDRRREAEEAKRQQELLIDITSHEIRNPISSLMQISPPLFPFLSCPFERCAAEWC
jgi:signal transduction histidine kinase